MAVHVEDAIRDLAAYRRPQSTFSDLREVAREHGLAAQLAMYFAAEEPEADAYLRAAAVRELRMASFQSRIVRELADAAIESWPYKGPALRAYLKAPAPRESGDLDILVREESVQSAYDALLIGRSAYGPGPQVRPHGMRKDAAIQGEQEFRIELHWALAAEFWKFRPEPLLWSQVRNDGQPSTNVMYSILAHHAVRHAAMRLQWLADLCLLTRLPNWSLAALTELATENGSRLAVDTSLVLLDRYLRISLPEYRASRRAEQIARQCIWGLRRRAAGMSTGWNRILVQMLLAPDKRALAQGLVQGHREKPLYPKPSLSKGCSASEVSTRP